MKRKEIIKVSLLILALSLPFFAKKAPVPSFISPIEEKIEQSREPVNFEYLAKREININVLDPFRINERAKYASINKQAPVLSGTISLIYQGRDKYVIINNSILREGDSFENFKILRILSDRVLLRGSDGEERWLQLN